MEIDNQVKQNLKEINIIANLLKEANELLYDLENKKEEIEKSLCYLKREVEKTILYLQREVKNGSR